MRTTGPYVSWSSAQTLPDAALVGATAQLILVAGFVGNPGTPVGSGHSS